MWLLWVVAGGCAPGGGGGAPVVPRLDDTGIVEPIEVLDANRVVPIHEPIHGSYDELFNPTVLQDIHLTLTAAAISALNEDGRTYVPATFEHDGTTLEVGVRLKGTSTYQDFNGKPAFRIKFNEVVPGQQYASLKRLALNNLTGDPAQGREVVSYIAWAAGGMPVPRAVFARVYVNLEYYGLYAAVEGVDQAWLQRHFPDPHGSLWAADPEADLTATGVGNFRLLSGTGDGPVTPKEATDALTEPSDNFMGQASLVVDMEQFLAFWAWSIATGGLDGYPTRLDDYYLYADPDRDGHLVFVPWGQDGAWDEAWTFGYGGGLLGARCEADPVCVVRLRGAVVDALAVLDHVDVHLVAQALFNLSKGAMEEDPRCPYAAPDVDRERSMLVDRIHDWPETVRLALGL
ncbi:MAG: CotH kinase family protein [Pseudomonadota bacterium]|nr:CotH kinase family protein [Pseudomonadota bacterium]